MSASATGLGAACLKSGPCNRQGGHLLGNIFDLYVHVQSVLAEPAQAGVGSGPAITCCFEARNGAVVDNFSLLVATTAINNLAHSYLGDNRA